MPILTLAFMFNFGILPIDDFQMYTIEDLPIEINLETFIEMQAELIVLNMFFIGGNIKVKEWEITDGAGLQAGISGLNFWSFGIASTIYAGFRYKGIEIYFKHYCNHPIDIYHYLQLRPQKEIIGQGSYEEIGIRLSGKIDLLK
jgi:hypothetical protein